MAGFEEARIEWRKSSKSNSGGCVEVAVSAGSVLVRDSVDPGGVVLALPPAAWSAFLQHARGGDPGPGRP